MSDCKHGARFAVIAGPPGTGKTTLLKAMVARAGGAPPTVDASPEARELDMTTEPNFCRFDYLGEPWTLADCPGSVELIETSLDLMRAADIVILVAGPERERAAGLSVYFRFLDAHRIPHVLFINRMDEAQPRVRDVLKAMQAYSQRPLVLRQVPLRKDGKIIGAVDLVSERAWKYREGEPSELIEIPEDAKTMEAEARAALLEALADFDDTLMEQILEDKSPPTQEVFALMARELRQDDVVPVLLGSAGRGNGVSRLLKLLRHEAPDAGVASARMGVGDGAQTAMSVIRTVHAPHIGKTSIIRVLKGRLLDGDTIDGDRLSGMMAIGGDIRQKQKVAKPGDIVGAPRMDGLDTGDLIIDDVVQPFRDGVPLFPPVFSRGVRANNEKDDMKLSAALQKLAEEDPSLVVDRRKDTGQLLLRTQGDMAMRLVSARLKNAFNIDIRTEPPKPAFRETIRSSVDHHARHKKQSGGHGQFADIKVKIRPLERGAGFVFEDRIHGGAVPRQFIPAVEAGVREGLETGPLGYPVVDLGVTLVDGQHHEVDSNEMSFKMAGRQAMRDGLAECNPVLLEPVYRTEIHAPSEHTNKMLGVVSARRGQILGFDARAGWPGWDTISAMLPEQSLSDLIIEIRSLSFGAATFEAAFDHYQQAQGRDSAKIVEERRQELSAARL